MAYGRYLGLVLTALVLAGCGVSKADHELVVADLEECQEESSRWESLYQESVEERRLALDQALEMLPGAHEELRAQIDVRLSEVTQTLDDTLRAEVQQSVYELAEAMAAGYNTLQQENKQLQAQLSESRSLIEMVLEKTGAIEEKAGTIEQRVGAERDAFLASRQALLLEIGEVEAFLRDWQYTHVDCKGCEERLRINNRERDALSQLHEEVISRLETVREKITSAG